MRKEAGLVALNQWIFPIGAELESLLATAVDFYWIST